MFLTRLLRISLFNNDCAALSSEKTYLAVMSGISVRKVKRDHQECEELSQNHVHLSRPSINNSPLSSSVDLLSPVASDIAAPELVALEVVPTEVVRLQPQHL